MPIIQYPSSSSGTNPPGTDLPKITVAAIINKSIQPVKTNFRAAKPATLMYFPVNESKSLLNPSKNRSKAFFLPVFLGFNKMAANAGLSVSALNAEKATEIAMVMANC